MESLVILGSGPAGCTAAIYAARAGFKPILLMGGMPGGLLTQTTMVENFPGFPDGISGYDLTEKMCQQAEKFGTAVRFDAVQKISFAPNANVLGLSNGDQLTAKAVILALGTRHRPLGLPGEEALRGHGLSYCATCDGAFFRNQPVAIVGGGDVALEEALVLTRFASAVHLIHRRNAFRGSKLLSDRVQGNPKITIHWNAIPIGLNGIEGKRLSGVRLQDTQTSSESTLPCAGLFVAIGLLPNTELLQGTALPLDENGYIKLATPAGSATLLPGVFAAGDCADPRYRQAITAAGMGAKAGIDATDYLNAN